MSEWDGGGSGRAEIGTRFTPQLTVLGLADVDMVRRDTNVACVRMRGPGYEETSPRGQQAEDENILLGFVIALGQDVVSREPVSCPLLADVLASNQAHNPTRSETKNIE